MGSNGVLWCSLIQGYFISKLLYLIDDGAASRTRTEHRRPVVGRRHMRPGATTQATGEELVLCATTGIAIVVIPEAELHRRTVFHDHPHIAVIGGVRFEQIIVRGCAAGEWMNPALKREARIPGVGIDGETHHNASCTPYPYGK